MANLSKLNVNGSLYLDGILDIEKIIIEGLPLSSYVENRKLQSSDIEGNDNFGGVIANNNVKIVVGVPRKSTTDYSSAGAIYIYDMDGNNEIKVVASDASEGAMFGNSVVMDDQHIIVGAYQDSAIVDNGGAIYIYDMDGNNEIKITPSDISSNDNFGYSLGVSNGKLIVGSPYEDSINDDSGATYLYDLEGNTISNEVKLKAPDAQANDHFGKIVSIYEDVVVVGVPDADPRGTMSGVAYIFDINSTPTLIKKINPAEATDYSYFGKKVKIYKNRIYISSKIAKSGIVYVYNKRGDYKHSVISSDAQDDDEFGIELDVIGDKILIGAYTEDEKASNAGAAYLFDLDGKEIIKLTASDAEEDDWFGVEVSIAYNRIIVGSIREDTSGSEAGTVYIFNNFENDISKIPINEIIYKF